jgi:hypothetical protein
MLFCEEYQWQKNVLQWSSTAIFARETEHQVWKNWITKLSSQNQQKIYISIPHFKTTWNTANQHDREDSSLFAFNISHDEKTCFITSGNSNICKRDWTSSVEKLNNKTVFAKSAKNVYNIPHFKNTWHTTNQHGREDSTLFGFNISHDEKNCFITSGNSNIRKRDWTSSVEKLNNKTVFAKSATNVYNIPHFKNTWDTTNQHGREESTLFGFNISHNEKKNVFCNKREQQYSQKRVDIKCGKME